jgi:hypothetical protein
MGKSWEDTDKYGDLLGALEHLDYFSIILGMSIPGWWFGTMEFDDFPFNPS